MTTTGVDRLAGLSSSVAIKAPCDYTTTANITLSGLGVQAGGTWVSTLTQDDASPVRILVKNQTNQIDNGIWNPGAGTWTRARDFDGARDVVRGTVCHVYQLNGDLWFEVSTANPVVIGSSAINFVASTATSILARLADQTSASNGDALYIIKRTFDGSVAITGHAWHEAFTIDLVRDCGADPTGVVPADTAMAKALAAVPASGGVITFGVGGVFSFASLIDINDRFCITLHGNGGLTGGSTHGTQLRFTGTGSESFLQFKSTTGCHVKDMQVMHSNTGFTGYLIDFGHSGAATDSALFSVERTLIGSTGGTRNALGINLNKCIEGRVLFNSFAGLVSAIRGQDSAGGSYSNAIDVIKNQFTNTTNPPIEYMGQAWTIDRNTFETRAGGVAGAISNSALTPVEGLSFNCNWCGDVTSGSGAWCTLFGGGLTAKNNYMGGSAASIAFSLHAFVGAKINGNKFQTFGTVFSFDATGCVDIDTTCNQYSSVTNIYGTKENSTDVYENDFAYTPTLTQAITQPTLGNGTLTGRYTRNGRRVDASFKLTIGSTTSFGTGAFRISVPYAANSGTQWCGQGVILDAGTAFFLVAGRARLGVAEVEFFSDASGTGVTQASPMTWAVGDTLDCSISYYT